MQKLLATLAILALTELAFDTTVVIIATFLIVLTVTSAIVQYHREHNRKE